MHDNGAKKRELFEECLRYKRRKRRKGEQQRQKVEQDGRMRSVSPRKQSPEKGFKFSKVYQRFGSGVLPEAFFGRNPELLREILLKREETGKVVKPPKILSLYIIVAWVGRANPPFPLFSGKRCEGRRDAF